MMLMPYSVLMRLSRYQTMYSSSIAVNSSIVTPRKLLLWKNSCLRRPKNPSAAALSGEQPFALIDRVSPDNAAAEGFFGRLKNELFYGRDWRGVGYEELRERLAAYLTHYNETRIKKSLDWMSPVQYRRSLGLAA